jgi:hypothetical protein
MVGQPDNFDLVLKEVTAWPPEHRASLAQAILQTLKQDAPGRKPTVDQIIGIARGGGPPPTDQQVEQWLDEHRMRKYG